MMPSAELVLQPDDALLARIAVAEDFHQCAERLRCLASRGHQTPLAIVLEDDAVIAYVAFERSADQWIAWKGPVGTPAPGVLRAILDVAAELAPVTLVLQSHWADEDTRSHSGFVVAPPFSTLLVPTAGEPQDHLAHMTDASRRRVRRATRAGLRFVEDPTRLRAFYEIYEASMRAAGSPDFASREELESYLRLDRAHLFLALLHDAPIAGSLCFEHFDAIEARYVATSREHRNLGPLNFVHFHCLSWARRVGLGSLDLSGLATGSVEDKLAAINRFKLGFGGVRLDYPVYRKV